MADKKRVEVIEVTDEMKERLEAVSKEVLVLFKERGMTMAECLMVLQIMLKSFGDSGHHGFCVFGDDKDKSRFFIG